MSPIRQETINLIEFESVDRVGRGGVGRRISRKKIVVAEGDDKDPGTWKLYANYMEDGASISQKFAPERVF